jgi:signal transduction histidine kinase
MPVNPDAAQLRLCWREVAIDPRRRTTQITLIEDPERLRRLQLITDTALRHLALDELLGELLVRTRDLLHVDTCAVLLLDEGTHELVARAAVGLEDEVERGVRIPLGRGFAGRVAAQRQPVILPDVDQADIVNPILREKGVKSMLGVPLLAGGRTIGVLHVGSLVHRLFGRDDVELLELVADRAAIAIDHARLYEAERAARARLEHLQAVTEAALAHLDVDDLLEVLLPRIRAILRADTCVVLLLAEDARELFARAAVGLEEEVERGVRIPLGRGFAGRIATDQRPVILDDLDHADVVNPILREKGIKSMLGVPLVAAGRTIGVLHVGSLVRRAFTPDETELLELVAERVAIGIERARLHQEVLQLDQLRLNFVAVASHELRTPATAVSGALVTLAARGDSLPEETREELFRVAHQQSERLCRLLEQLFDLSRLDAQAIRVDPQPLVLHSVLSQIAEETIPPGTESRLEVRPDLAAVADPLVLDRVLGNLLVNAVRHGMPPIVVTAERRNRHLRIAVEDAGPGVAPDVLPRLFERFARTEAGPGSGLGLALARAYAQAHGGDLVYDPNGGGTRFELILPQG